MRVTLLSEIPEDETLRQSWNGLVQQMEHPEVFYTHEWAAAVQRAYRASVIPLLLLCYEADLLVGLVALARGTSGGGDAVFLTVTTGDYCDFLSHPARRLEVVGAFLAELRKLKVSTLVLANLPADSATLAALRSAAESNGYRLYSRLGYECGQVALGSLEQREALKQNLSRKKVLRQAWQKLQRIAPVTVRHDSCWAEVAPALPIFFQAHVARFLATGRSSNLAQPERQVFLSELARELAAPGWLVFSRLMIGDRAVGWNYGFQFGGSWFWYQPTFDSDYEKLSPGGCLLSRIVEAACDRPDINLVDLGLGREEYKERFATGSRKILHVTMNSSLGSHIRTITRHQVARVAMASPVLERAIRALRGRFVRWRGRIREGGAQ